MSPLRLLPEARADLRAACESAYPHEACGLLLGVITDPRVVCRVIVARNLEESGTRFTLDPADFARADGVAQDAGLEIMGIFHSHPDQPARPSRADESAAQRGWSHVIASVHGDGVRGRLADMTSWWLTDDASQGALIEERIEWAADARGLRSG